MRHRLGVGDHVRHVRAADAWKVGQCGMALLDRFQLLLKGDGLGQRVILAEAHSADVAVGRVRNDDVAHPRVDADDPQSDPEVITRCQQLVRA